MITTIEKKYSVPTPGVSFQNRRGEWVPAIPEPYHLLFKVRCECGDTFWKRESYDAHFALKHILAL